MKKGSIIILLTAVAAFQLSCSATLQKRYDQRHGTSTYDSDRYRNTRSTGSDDSYRRDYSKINEGSSRGAGDADYNRNLVLQYQEMDKLGEVVLYEISNLEKRWDTLIGEYRSARNSGRQVISDQLDRIDEDQKMLYKAYTRIYRDGKSNWPAVKSEVESTLNSVRRADR
ncbi:hypothetical protein [Dyadobacter crusticola]|uniref:hypothetical protein n=1 Tax=Dyadobacter crusticola TaxID=292407 RepID=UPI0004E15E15|nr:hypothetical protein [Dyadobacter crusticola]